jgi:hypothetical protein
LAFSGDKPWPVMPLNGSVAAALEPVAVAIVPA